MGELRRISITLPAEMADAIDARVKSGAYCSESEVIQEGLRVLQDREQSLEDWLREEVAASYDEWLANPGSALSSAELREALARDRESR